MISHLIFGTKEETAPSARYWKIYINSSSWVTVQPVEVELISVDNGLGVTVVDTESIIAGLAEQEANPGVTVYTDGLLTGTWDVDVGESLVFDLGTPDSASFVRWANYTEFNYPTTIKVGYSDNGVDWTMSQSLACGTVGVHEFSGNNYIPIIW